MLSTLSAHHFENLRRITELDPDFHKPDFYADFQTIYILPTRATRPPRALVPNERHLINYTRVASTKGPINLSLSHVSRRVTTPPPPAHRASWIFVERKWDRPREKCNNNEKVKP